MKYFLFTFLLSLCFIPQTDAQDYEAAAGLRLGFPTSLSYKRFVVEDKAFELTGGWRSRTDYNEIRLNAAYLFHKPVGDTEYFKWYWGFGAGVTFYLLGDSIVTEETGSSIQANGYLGIEYTLEGIPLQLSLDWVPTFSIGGFKRGIQGGIGGVAIRYIISQ